MRGKFLIAGLAATLLPLAGALGAAESVEEIMAKIQKANDPGGEIGKIKTEVLECRVKIDSKKEGGLTIRIQFPDKMRMDVEGKDEKMIRCFNGEKGWQFSTKDGLREITGDELCSLKFQTVFMMPDTNFKEIFEKAEIEEEEAVRGQACYRLKCTPLPAYKMQPITLFVDKKTYLVAKTVETHTLKDGPVQLTKSYDEYEDFDGVMIPTSIITESGSMLVDITVESVVWNEDIDPSFFNMPQEIGK